MNNCLGILICSKRRIEQIILKYFKKLSLLENAELYFEEFQHKNSNERCNMLFTGSIQQCQYYN